MTIYMRQIPTDITEAEVTDVFKKHGEVKQVRFPLDPKTGERIGYALIDMGDKEQEEDTIEELNGEDLKGVKLRLNRNVD